MPSKPLVILVDFDGTAVAHEFPIVGREIGSVVVLKRLLSHGHKLVLFTMRSDIQKPVSDDTDIICQPGQYLTDALNWFKKWDIELYGIQTNPTQAGWTSSPKAYGNIMLDDSALGAPLIHGHGRPFFDWVKAEVLLTRMGLFNDELFPIIQEEVVEE